MFCLFRACTCMYVYMHVGVDVLSQVYGPQRSNSGHQDWWQAPFPVEPFFTFKFFPTHAAQIPQYYKLGGLKCSHFFLRVLEAGIQGAGKIPSPLLFYIYLFFVCVTHTCGGQRIICMLSSFLLPCGSQGLDSDCQAWWLALLHTVHHHACPQVCFILFLGLLVAAVCMFT